MEAGPQTTVEDVSKVLLLRRLQHETLRLETHLAGVDVALRAIDGFKRCFDDACVQCGIQHDHRDLYRFSRTFESIEFIVKNWMINNSDWNLDEETNYLFWPYSTHLTIEERTRFDSTYNMIARPLFWITYCWDCKNAAIFFRKVCLWGGFDIANRHTTVQNDNNGYFTVMELLNEIISETTHLPQFILGNIEVLKQWSPAQNFGEP